MSDGTYFGFVLSITAAGDGHWLEVEPAEMFGGEEALEKAQEDGLVALGSPHYIRRSEGERWTLWVEASVVPLGVVDSAAPTPVSWDEFVSGYSTSPPLGFAPYPIYLTVSGGEVDGVEQQYLP